MNYLLHTPETYGFNRYFGLCALIALQACSTNPVSLNAGAQPDTKAEVRIQICLPTKRIYFKELELDKLKNHPLFTKYSQQQLELAPKKVRRVANSTDSKAIHQYGIIFGEVLFRSGQFSDGHGFMSLRDSTIADQPIYERGYGYPAQNYVAIHVNLPESERGLEGNVTYWFKLPKSILDEKFSNWINPVFIEPDQAKGNGSPPTRWKLMQGENLETSTISPDAPKMRVTLTNRRIEHNDPTIDYLPALTTARTIYKTEISGQQFVYEFVPKADEVIPKCD